MATRHAPSSDKPNNMRSVVEQRSIERDRLSDDVVSCFSQLTHPKWSMYDICLQITQRSDQSAGKYSMPRE